MLLIILAVIASSSTFHRQRNGCDRRAARHDGDTDGLEVRIRASGGPGRQILKIVLTQRYAKEGFEGVGTFSENIIWLLFFNFSLERAEPSAAAQQELRPTRSQSLGVIRSE